MTIPDGPFAGGTTMHASYLRLRLDTWYGQLSQQERVARMYAPQVTQEQVSHFTTDAESDPNLLGQAISRYGVIGHAQTSATARRNGKPIILRRDFDTTDGGQAGLHFVALQRTIEDFVTTRTAMNATSAQLRNPSITDTVNNGINEFIFVTKRGNYLLPTRGRALVPAAARPGSRARLTAVQQADPANVDRSRCQARTRQARPHCAVAALCAVADRSDPNGPRCPKGTRWGSLPRAGHAGSLRSERDHACTEPDLSRLPTPRAPARTLSPAAKRGRLAPRGRACCPPTPTRRLTGSEHGALLRLRDSLRDVLAARAEHRADADAAARLTRALADGRLVVTVDPAGAAGLASSARATYSNLVAAIAIAVAESLRK